MYTEHHEQFHRAELRDFDHGYVQVSHIFRTPLESPSSEKNKMIV
jgi:hypothetical protein